MVEGRGLSCKTQTKHLRVHRQFGRRESNAGFLLEGIDCDLKHSRENYDNFGNKLGECFPSKPFNLPYDLRHRFGLEKIYENPRVITAYVWKYYLWFKYATRHWAVKWFVENVANGGGMHLAKFMLGEEEMWLWDGGECHPRPAQALVLKTEKYGQSSFTYLSSLRFPIPARGLSIVIISPFILNEFIVGNDTEMQGSRRN
ncbi:hypothetical protein C8R43DRAFT_1144030 [Mycena crocata]|nr:hypothetical protein C8R43DRAFT_1144030 [Mycena crocata]